MVLQELSHFKLPVPQLLLFPVQYLYWLFFWAFPPQLSEAVHL